MLFVLSAGRSGSRTIANALSQSRDMLCTHEPMPRLLVECAMYRYGEFDADELAGLLRESRPSGIDDRRYGESANRLSLAVPVLAQAFPEAQFLWLVRDGREFVASGMQRGWFADAKDTEWEQWRLSGDRLGEVASAEWEQWTPFRRVCWLWRRTNEIIRDDIAALASGRWRLVRLETLADDLDGVADFLQIEKANWSVGRLNARGTDVSADEPGVNKVVTRLGPESWNDEEQNTFERECGGLMDELYPEWRGRAVDTTEPVGQTVEANAPMDAVTTELAELRVIRGELNLLVDHVRGVDRRYRLAMAERDQVRENLDHTRSDRDRLVVDADRERVSLEAEIGALTSSALDLSEIAERRASAQAEVEAELAVAKREARLIRESESFRLGHAIVSAATLPRRGGRRLVRSAKRSIRRRIRSAVKRLAARPSLVRLATRLPDSISSRLVGIATSTTPRRAGPKSTRKKLPVHSARLGLRAVVDSEVDSTLWGRGMDACSIDSDIDQLTHIDILLAADEPSTALASLAAENDDAVVVRTHLLVPPLPPGLTPLGVTREHSGELLAIGTSDGVVASPRTHVAGRETVLRSLDDLPDPISDPHEFRLELQSYLALIDEPRLHDNPHRRAYVLLCASATGLPVFVSDPADIRELVAPDVVRAWTDFDVRLLTRHLDRERISWRQRSLVHRHHSASAVYDKILVEGGRPGLSTPPISVLVASNRPDLVSCWGPQLGAQDHPDFEVIWAQHGDGFSAAHEEQARQHLSDRLTIVRVPEHHTLGDALNAATTRSAGDVLVKWDDDDLYDSSHLVDLATARSYSGAELVGKAAEFVYLESLDVTIRRFDNSTEAYSTTIGGPTLSIGRGDLHELGGWRRTRRRVDALLIEDVRAAGGSTYRTSGFGFVMVRASSSDHAHTWSAADDYFLASAIEQRRGLDLEFASVRSPEGLEIGS